MDSRLIMTFNTKTYSYRFPLWLTVIFLTLFSTPILILYNNITLAKIAGIVTVLLTTIAIRFWIRIARIKTGVIDKVPLTNNDLFDLKRTFPYFNNLSQNEMTIYKDKIGVVLSKIRFLEETGEHYSKLESIQLAFYIVLLDLVNLVGHKNSIIIINNEDRDFSSNENDTVIKYPIKAIIDDKSIGLLKFHNIKQHESIVAFTQFMIKHNS